MTVLDPARSVRRQHAAPTTGDAFRAQLALLAAPPHRGVLIALGLILLQLILLASSGLVVGIVIGSTDGPNSGAHLSRVTDLGVDEGVAAVVFAYFAAVLWGVFWPGRVVRDSRGQGRAYHWALPVDRRIHDLVRVAAGGIWLVPLSALLIGTAVVVATIAGHGEHLTRFPASAWIAFFLGPQLAYLLGSIPSLMKGRRQLLWLWPIVGAWVCLFWLLAVAGNGHLLEELFVGPFGLLRAFAGPFFSAVDTEGAIAPDPWLPAFLVWFTAALFGVLAAAADRGHGDS